MRENQERENDEKEQIEKNDEREVMRYEER